MDIYLVRHTSVDVPPGHTYGHTDVPLRPTFEEEASAVKAKLNGILFDKVYTSPLSRCVRLANYCGFPDAEQADDLKEIDFGEWEMKSWDELSADPRSADWFADWINTPAPQGESMSGLYRRVSRFLDKLRAGNREKVCLFAHGGVLTCARIYAGLYKMEKAFDNMPEYGAVIKIRV
ncbi:MAG: alpha-ribazole phosphatase [Tannerellaceae bacterium]|jgi:alpha-ribazole phosphatase|nr:alpha-ribazole phosphatase [Tannerellaceae bacterium]